MIFRTTSAKSPFRTRIAAIACCTGILTSARGALASGLYFSEPGVRPLSRGGAFVAGADDLGSIAYNPAGLADAGTSLFADFSWLHFSSDYTRRSQVADSAGTLRTYTFPTVQGTTPVLPIPTIAGSYQFGREKEWTVAVGVHAPYTAIVSYPLTVEGAPSPSRYSVVSLDGSALVAAGGYVAYKPIEALRFGLGLKALVGTFASTVVFTASPPDNLIAASEDPAYDAFSRMKVGPIFAPTANAGVIAIPEKHIRIGISGQLPFLINAPATVDVRLPSAAVFDKASQVGNEAHVKFELPAILGIGVEVRPIERLRVEATYVREFWSSHQSIDIHPDNIQIQGVTGFPKLGVTPISIPRNFENTNSYRLGGELRITSLHGYAIDLRAGVNYEQSAIPAAYLSPLTIDLDKVTVGFGGGLHVGKHWRFDAVYAHIFASDQTVTPGEAAVPRVTPIQGNPTPKQAINGGTYSARADVLGVGVNYKFE